MRRLGTLAWWVLTPVACVVVVAIALRDLPDAWRASRSSGTVGLAFAMLLALWGATRSLRLTTPRTP